MVVCLEQMVRGDVLRREINCDQTELLLRMCSAAETWDAKALLAEGYVIKKE